MDTIVKEFISDQCLTANDAEVEFGKFYEAFTKWYQENYSMRQPSRLWFMKEITKEFQRKITIKIKGIQLL